MHAPPLALCRYLFYSFFFFNDTATTEIYTLSLHDALPISPQLLAVQDPRLAVRRRDGRRLHRGGVGADPGLRQGEGRDRTLRDRKSTRLNSSHSQISYAVFCLKKKKKYDIANTLVVSGTLM